MTVISNQFIDTAMAEAGGEYVKIYLYLLRMAQDPSADFSIARMAELLKDTEKDVLRALKYWEKQGWLQLDTEADGSLGGIRIISPESPAAENTAADKGTIAPSEEAKAKKAVVRPVTAETMEQLRKDEEFSQFTFVAETYLGRALTPKDVQLFAYLYDELKFPADLLEYLVEYCVGGGHRSCRYMETVALGWHQEGLLTVHAVKEAGKAYSKENKAVMKAFGINGRMLNEEERSYVDRWVHEYNMPLEVVTEACHATVNAIQKPSFPYTESILADWHKAGVRTKEDAKARRESRKASRGRENEAAQNPSGGTRFQNYQQRNIDYDALLNQGGLNPYGKD